MTDKIANHLFKSIQDLYLQYGYNYIDVILRTNKNFDSIEVVGENLKKLSKSFKDSVVFLNLHDDEDDLLKVYPLQIKTPGEIAKILNQIDEFLKIYNECNVSKSAN